SRPGTYGGGLQAFTGSPGGDPPAAETARATPVFPPPPIPVGRPVAGGAPRARDVLCGCPPARGGTRAPGRGTGRRGCGGWVGPGLAHEVNNPAAAALRAAGDLRGALQGLEDVVAWLAEADVPAERAHALLALRRDAVDSLRPVARGGIELANAEDAIGTWLD